MTDYKDLLMKLLEAIDYSFMKPDRTYNKELTYPVIDKVNWIKKQIENESSDFGGRVLMKFDDDYFIGNTNPKQDGYYMTVRCGLSGIYTFINEWKNNRWQIGISDASTVIAYSKETLSKENVEK